MKMMLIKLYLNTKSNYTTLIKLLDQYLLKLLKYTITRLLKIRGGVFTWKMGGGRGKELKTVKYGHHEEATPASKLPNTSFLFKLTNMLQKSLWIPISCHGNMETNQINKTTWNKTKFEPTWSLLPSLVFYQASVCCAIYFIQHIIWNP